MLDRAHRLTHSALFASTVRRGRRAGSRTLVVHLVTPDEPTTDAPRIGLVVGKAVGKAVTRSLVKRRLRHLAREHLAVLPGGAVLVIRALPPAGTATNTQLRDDLARLLDRVLPQGASR